MTESVWWPVSIVLGAGLVLGLLAMGWLKRRERPAMSTTDDLEQRDLLARRDEIYHRLETEELESSERTALEDEAARILRRLDEIGVDVPTESVRITAPPPAEPEIRSTAGATVRGFVAGVAFSALVGALVFWAGRDAAPREEGMSATGSLPERAAVPPAHPEGPQLSREQTAELESLRQRIEEAPEDIAARKRYMLALLRGGRFVEAFQVAEDLLGVQPEDPDGLYVAGMVRLRMGQDDIALDLLDRVLAQYPDHVLALTAKGVALTRKGNDLAAQAVWSQALEASGGRNPQVEALLGSLAGGAASSPAPPQAAAGPTFGARIELPDGAGVPPGAVLFVFLRSGEGPPAAVRRIDRPSFPMEIELGPADSMLGRPLPDSGSLSARLDADGSASTKDDSDLEAEAGIEAGGAVTLRLE